MEIIGKSPVPLSVLILGKLALLGCWIFFLLKPLVIDTLLYDSIATQSIGIALFAIGLTLLLLSLVQLGRSAAIGIPERETQLKTHGMYRLSRNPVYIGAFAMCAGSCVFSMHVLNFLFFALTASVHHLIVRKEEEFLEKRFGERWRQYRDRVPRYVGWKRARGKALLSL